MTLPLMPENLIKQIERLIKKFLWNNKKEKIKFRILQRSKEQGGLGLANLKMRDRAMKISWIKILENSPKVANLAYNFLEPKMGSDIWLCNLNSKDIDLLFTHRNEFWSDVLKSWSFAHYNKENLIDQPIWYNTNIRIENKPFFWAKCYKRGLLYVHQLYENEQKISLEKASEYGLSFLDLHSLYEAIDINPQINKPRTGLANYERLILFPNMVAQTYRELIFTNEQFTITCTKWEKEMNTTFMHQDLLHAIKHIYRCTNVIKYRSFQYRLLTRGIITNIDLFKWKIISTELCSFCNLFPETYKHLFYECQVVKQVWTRIEVNLLKGEFSNEYQNIICNTVSKQPGNYNNFICLLFKQYVYSKKCMKQDISINEFAKVIRYTKNIEKYNALKANRIKYFNIKWGIQDTSLSQPQTIEEYIRVYNDNV